MGFVKIDCGMLESTLWPDIEARNVFVTALLMATPIEIKQPMAQLQVRSLAETGFVVPPGWYGFVNAAGIGIVSRSCVDRDAGLDALERLGSPEPDSRSSDFDGRRLVRVDGGYVVLNYIKYRDRDYTAAERSKRWRERSKRRDATRDRRNDTQAEAEAEAEAKMDGCMDRTTPFVSEKNGDGYSTQGLRQAGDIAAEIVNKVKP